MLKYLWSYFKVLLCINTCHLRVELQYFMLTKYEGAGRLVKRLMSRITDVLVNNSASDDLSVSE